MIKAAARTPGKDRWKPTGIKSDNYELRANEAGTLTLWHKGKILPYQTDLTFKQKMNDAVSVTVTLMFG